jgi:hypothetical protein
MGGARHRVDMYRSTGFAFFFTGTCRHGEGKARNLLAEARDATCVTNAIAML